MTHQEPHILWVDQEHFWIHCRQGPQETITVMVNFYQKDYYWEVLKLTYYITAMKSFTEQTNQHQTKKQHETGVECGKR